MSKSGGNIEKRLNLFVEAEVERQELLGKLRPYVEKRSFHVRFGLLPDCLC